MPVVAISSLTLHPTVVAVVLVAAVLHASWNSIAHGIKDQVLAGRRPHGSRAAIVAAVATGLTIATYTTVDGIGVRLSGASFGYTGWLILLEGSTIPLWALAWRRGALVRQVRPVAAVGLTGGVLSLL